MPRFRRSLASPRLAVVLVALALLVRIAVPAGWMPAANGGLGIVLCNAVPGDVASAAQARLLAAALPDDRDSRGKHDAADQPCAFAGLAAALVAPFPPASAAPIIAAAADPEPKRNRALAPGRGLAAPPPPPTGPPLLA